jgi:hypothetical protein
MTRTVCACVSVTLVFVAPIDYSFFSRFTMCVYMYMYMQIGMTIHCRILRVNLEKFSVDLTCKSSDLLDKEGRFRYVSTM